MSAAGIQHIGCHHAIVIDKVPRIARVRNDAPYSSRGHQDVVWSNPGEVVSHSELICKIDLLAGCSQDITKALISKQSDTSRAHQSACTQDYHSITFIQGSPSIILWPKPVCCRMPASGWSHELLGRKSFDRCLRHSSPKQVVRGKALPGYKLTSRTEAERPLPGGEERSVSAAIARNEEFRSMSSS